MYLPTMGIQKIEQTLYKIILNLYDIWYVNIS